MATTFQSHDALEQTKNAIQSVMIRTYVVCDRKRCCRLHYTMRQQFAPLFGVGGDRLFWPGFTRENDGDLQLSPDNQARKQPDFTTTRLMTTHTASTALSPLQYVEQGHHLRSHLDAQKQIYIYSIPSIFSPPNTPLLHCTTLTKYLTPFRSNWRENLSESPPLLLSYAKPDSPAGGTCFQET